MPKSTNPFFFVFSRRFLAFCVVGTVGLLVDLAALHALAPWAGWYVGRVISFIAAASTTWYFNRRYTFADAPAEGGAGLARQYLRYLVSMLGGAAVNYAAYVATLQFLTSPYAPAWGVAFGSLAGLAVNFASANWVVFRRGPAR
ncbi:MAG: GtrA family protein [Ramlibacter sp.]